MLCKKLCSRLYIKFIRNHTCKKRHTNRFGNPRIDGHPGISKIPRIPAESVGPRIAVKTESNVDLV